MSRNSRKAAKAVTLVRKTTIGLSILEGGSMMNTILDKPTLRFLEIKGGEGKYRRETQVVVAPRMNRKMMKA